MLAISKKSEYGLLLLAELDEKNPASLSEVAKKHTISPKYLSKLAIQLKKAGLIQSKEGKGGGYFLSTAKDHISLISVLDALEEKAQVSACGGHGAEGCCGRNMCPTRDVWPEIEQKVRERLSHINLSNLTLGKTKNG